MPSSRRSTESDTEATEAKASTESQADTSDTKDAPFYCPGCGRRYEYRQQCTGRPEAPHPPIEVVSTDELSVDTHTAAPDTTNLG